MNPPQGTATTTDERVLNELDTYGPAYMRIAERLGGYEETEAEAEQVIELLGLQPGDARARRGVRLRPLRRSAPAARDGSGRHRHLAGGDRRSASAAARARSYLVHDLTQPLPEGVGTVRRARERLLAASATARTEAEDLEMLACLHRAIDRAAGS